MKLIGSPLDRSRRGLEACVHCGFCLPACPTYAALDDENDSPRGRLVLMGALLDGRVAPTDADVHKHIDQCLGCRGCETACPSGVPYGELLEATRATLSEYRSLPWRARIVLAVFSHRWLLGPSLFLARVFRDTGLPLWLARQTWLPRGIAMPLAMLASTQRPERANHKMVGHKANNEAASIAETIPAGTASLLTGCVMEGLLSSLNRDTQTVLAENGWKIVSTPAQVCCGALHAHAGDPESARRLARRNIAAFEASGAQTIVMNSAGCGAICREYHHLLSDDPEWRERAAAFSSRVRDVHELLAAKGPRPAGTESTASKGSTAGKESTAGAEYTSDLAAGRNTNRRIAWDAPCHLQHGQRIVSAPLAVLNALSNTTIVPLADSDQCCGSAGIFTLVQPDVSERVFSAKSGNIELCDAEIIATANPGCLMQIGGGLILSGSSKTARHTVELLAEDYAKESPTG